MFCLFLKNLLAHTSILGPFILGYTAANIKSKQAEMTKCLSTLVQDVEFNTLEI